MTATVVGGTDAPQVRRVELDVSGMTCAACAARVENRLNKIDGVRASVNYATRVATVDAPNPSPTTTCARWCAGRVTRPSRAAATPITVLIPMTPSPGRSWCGWLLRQSCSCHWPIFQ